MIWELFLWTLMFIGVAGTWMMLVKIVEAVGFIKERPVPAILIIGIALGFGGLTAHLSYYSYQLLFPV